MKGKDIKKKLFFSIMKIPFYNPYIYIYIWLWYNLTHTHEYLTFNVYNMLNLINNLSFMCVLLCDIEELTFLTNK